MDRKNIIIIGLILLLVASIGFALMMAQQKVAVEQAAARDRELFENEKGKFEQKIQENNDKINALNETLDNALRKEEELNRRVQLAEKSRDELIAKLQSAQKAAPVAPVEAYQEARPSTADDAYWAGVLKTKKDLELQLDNVRLELRSLQIGNEQLQRQKSDLELEVKNLMRDKEELARKIEYNQKIMDSIAQELVREKNEKIATQGDFKTIKNENTLLRRQLNSLNNRKVELERKYADLQQQDAALKEKLNSMDAMVKEKITEMDTFKRQFEQVVPASVTSDEPKVQPAISKDVVELAPIVVRAQPEAAAVAQDPTASAVTTSAAVLAINRENNFVIIDKGEDVGLQIGDKLRVYSQDKPIANIEIIQTRKEIAACDIKQEMQPIKVGDIVR
ncbi:MAG: hypothetical protein KBA46_02415 [Candidatus Omnitrophica bacterium]|nr:hypothetical protein [Candidatus Omnitrophota bacterium]